MPQVIFELLCETKPGERLFVVGSHTTLGCWSPSLTKAELRTVNGRYPLWEGAFDLPAGAAIQFKFVVLTTNAGYIWEAGTSNRDLQVPIGNSDILEVAATYGQMPWSSPGPSFKLPIIKVQRLLEEAARHPGYELDSFCILSGISSSTSVNSQEKGGEHSSNVLADYPEKMNGGNNANAGFSRETSPGSVRPGFSRESSPVQSQREISV